MAFADARAFCPNLQSQMADPQGDADFLHVLRRWATRYCPWVGIDGVDGLTLDITGSAHLYGGEAALLADMRARLSRAGFTAQIGLADTRGAAWALAHFGEGVAAAGEAATALGDLPVAGLRLEPDVVIGLQRLGLRKIADIAATARAPLTRRFGPAVLMRLDQAMGDLPEDVTPLTDPPRYSVRMTLPEPIGLLGDVMAGTERLLIQLSEKLTRTETGARILSLQLRRVDQAAQQVELRLARPLRDPARILALFERGISDVDAGFGIDQLRVEAVQVEKMPARQISHVGGGRTGRLDDLISRIGTRIGLENVHRYLPAESHIPERSYITAAAAWSDAQGSWAKMVPRPLTLFRPEPIVAEGPVPPSQFRWRRMPLTLGRAIGPERIAPEWWFADENWQSGLRDYWRIHTVEGRRLWMFFTPQNPGWFVQGEFA